MRRINHAGTRWVFCMVSVMVCTIAFSGCGSTGKAGSTPGQTADRLATQKHSLSSPSASASPTSAAHVPILVGSDAVALVREPNTYSYRNYCVPGAISMLLSMWTAHPPGIDAIAAEAKLQPDFGVWGNDAVAAINHYLIPIIGSGNGEYVGTHLSSPAELVSAIEESVPSGSLLPLASHGTPVLVHVMTGSLPGWDGYEAQHMIAVIGYDFRGGTAAADTVTYAESAGSVAGYNGPGTETVTIEALWSAVLSYHRYATDPVDMIAFSR